MKKNLFFIFVLSFVFLFSCDSLKEIKQIDSKYFGIWEEKEVSWDQGKTWIEIPKDMRILYDIENEYIEMERGTIERHIIKTVFELTLNGWGKYNIVFFIIDDYFYMMCPIVKEEMVIVIHSLEKIETERILLHRIR